MIIGIDARLLISPSTGIGRYTLEMCRELIKCNEIFSLYMPSAPAVDQKEFLPAKIRVGSFSSKIGRVIWSQTFLPLYTVLDKLDVFWSATHRLPLWLPKRVARVVTVHDLVWRHAPETMKPLSRWLDSHLMPSAVYLADRVVAVSDSTAFDVVREWPNAINKVRVVYPGPVCLPTKVDIDISSLFGINRPYVLFVGTHEPRKNIQRLIAAFALIPKNILHNTQLVIAGGPGWGGVNVLEIVRNFGLEESVVITGYVSDDVLSALYAKALVLTMPSLYEGFGLPVVEAMSHGTPVVVSSISSLPEVAGDAGLVVDPYDIEAISRALVCIIEDDDMRHSLALKAVEVSRQFSWPSAARAMIQVFCEAINVRKS